MALPRETAMNQRDQAKQLHDLADMCRAEDHLLAEKTAHIIHTIASNVACGYLETAKSTAHGLVHAFETIKILRGLDPTYAELTAQIVGE